MKYDNALEQSMRWAIANHPTSSQQHKAAFANSVAYLVTGSSGGYGGPSIREHAVSWALAGDGFNEGMLQFPDGRLKRAGEWTFEEAIAFASPICFGVLPASAERIYEEEQCFDDDPADLQELANRKK